jgi:TonB-dependent SusC/RagA subfamily outer membrane receptor
MERKYKVILSIVLLLLSAVAWGQNTVVSGVVSDENGVPLLGVSVVEDGTTNGVSTDQKGAYTIRLKGVNPVLSFHYIGYTSRKIEVNRRTTIDVVLVETATTLNDVVVVGYGVQKKVNVTGAVTSIDFEKQMAGRAIVNPSTALSGLVAGMNVAQTSGQPGSDAATIRLRGTGTFSSSGNSPLVLVDGIEWSMNDINPNDIASVSVLKDAASTAIYGTRAANGVILIKVVRRSIILIQELYRCPIIIWNL